MSSKILVCTQCNYVGEPKGAIGGNGCIEVILWLCFIIPGLIYSIWRSSSRHKICPKCKSPSLIPMDSPRAQKIISEVMSKEELEKIKEEDKETTQKNLKLRKKILIAVAIFIGFIILINIIS